MLQVTEAGSEAAADERLFVVAASGFRPDGLPGLMGLLGEFCTAVAVLLESSNLASPQRQPYMFTPIDWCYGRDLRTVWYWLSSDTHTEKGLSGLVCF